MNNQVGFISKSNVVNRLDKSSHALLQFVQTDCWIDLLCLKMEMLHQIGRAEKYHGNAESTKSRIQITNNPVDNTVTVILQKNKIYIM